MFVLAPLGSSEIPVELVLAAWSVHSAFRREAGKQLMLRVLSRTKEMGIGRKRVFSRFVHFDQYPTW